MKKDISIQTKCNSQQSQFIIIFKIDKTENCQYFQKSEDFEFKNALIILNISIEFIKNTSPCKKQCSFKINI